MKWLGIENAEQAISVISRYYLSETMPPKTRFGLEEIFGPAESNSNEPPLNDR